MAAKDQQFSIQEEILDDTCHACGNTEEKPEKYAMDKKVLTFDVTGLSCPGPLMKLRENMETVPIGTIAKFTASDPGFYNDSQAWCERTGHVLLQRERQKGLVSGMIQKKGSLISSGSSGLCGGKSTR